MLTQTSRKLIVDDNTNQGKLKLQESLEWKMQKFRNPGLHILQKQTYPHLQKMLEHNCRKGD